MNSAGKRPRPRQARQPADPGTAQRADADQLRDGQGQLPHALRVTITLMDTAARTERDIAESLRDMAGQGGGEVTARRLELAAEAARGAQEAERRSTRLRELARRWTERAEAARLHRLLAEAAQALTGLARTQHDIAAAFAVLAGQDGSALAAERRRLAAAATANARDAQDQAQSLRQLAATSAAGTHHPSPPRP